MPDAKDYICDLTPYQPGMSIAALATSRGLDPAQIIKLASNENPLGSSPAATSALKRELSDMHRYPEQQDATGTLAKHYGVNNDMVILGNGSNDVLDLVARTYLGKGDEAVVSQYAFAMYQIAVQSVGATTIVVPAKDYGHDLDAMMRAITSRTKVIWIANPNNPTGTFIPYASIKTFLDKVPQEIIVVLDEAYYEYLSHEDRVDTIAWLAQYPNLILVRTFSKIYGLAGLRIGYGIAQASAIEPMHRVRLPFNVNSLAAAAVKAALHDTGFVQRSQTTNETGRQQLLSAFKKLHIATLPAYGNFVTIRTPLAAALNEALLAGGIIVRPLSGYDMADSLRITVGTEPENKKLLECIEQFLRSA